MDLLANTYDKNSIAYTLVESVNELILRYELENKKISDKTNREELKDIQSNLEIYGNKVVKGKIITLLSAKTNSTYESNLKKLKDSIVRMLSDNNQLANKFINIPEVNYTLGLNETISPLGLEAGFLVNLPIGRTNLSIEYDIGARSNYISHTGALRLAYKF